MKDVSNKNEIKVCLVDIIFTCISFKVVTLNLLSTYLIQCIKIIFPFWHAVTLSANNHRNTKFSEE